MTEADSLKIWLLPRKDGIEVSYDSDTEQDVTLGVISPDHALELAESFKTAAEQARHMASE